MRRCFVCLHVSTPGRSAAKCPNVAINHVSVCFKRGGASAKKPEEKHAPADTNDFPVAEKSPNRDRPVALLVGTSPSILLPIAQVTVFNPADPSCYKVIRVVLDTGSQGPI